MHTERGVVMPAMGGGPSQEEVASIGEIPSRRLFAALLLPRQQPGHQGARS